MAKRNYPNDYYAWYNDDDRLAIVEKVTSSDGGSVHHDTYDTFQSSGDLSGNLTASSDSAGAFVDFTSASHGLAVNDRVTIDGTDTYDGNHTVTVVGDANTFRIAATNSEADEGDTSGVTFTSLFVDNGFRLTYHSKYTTVSAVSNDLGASGAGLDSGMHHHLLCYVRARLLEDMGDLERASYYRKMFEMGIKQYPMRKSGVRALAVPKL